jgi:hypothetical protein
MDSGLDGRLGARDKGIAGIQVRWVVAVDNIRGVGNHVRNRGRRGLDTGQKR